MKINVSNITSWADYYLDPLNSIEDPKNQGVMQRKIISKLFKEDPEASRDKKAINKLACDFMTFGHASHGSKFKWFGESPFFYSRINDTARLILLIGRNDKNQLVLIVVGVNTRHNYQKYKETNNKLTDNTFKNFIGENENILLDQKILVVKSQNELTQLKNAMHSTLETTEIIEATASQPKSKKSIVFSETQQRILNRPGDQMVLGGPGTGKTFVGIGLAIEAELTLVNENPTSEEAFFITFMQPKKELAEQTKRLYEEQRQEHRALDSRKSLVQFITYESWVRPFFHGKKEVDFLEFETWLQKTGYKTLFNEETKRLDLYSEMQIAAGFLKPSLYLEAGERTTRLEKEEEPKLNRKKANRTNAPQEKKKTAREIVLEIYAAYIEVLTENQQVDFSLCAPELPQEIFANQRLMVIDESQDIFLPIFPVLFNHPLRSKLILLGDNHQKTDQNASIPFVSLLQQNYFAAVGNPLKVQTLQENYRCPKTAITFAQMFLNLKLCIDEGTNSKEQYTSYTAHENNRNGEVVFTHNPSFENLAFDTVVIASNLTTKESIEKKHPQLFVMLPNEVKGLEFEQVIAYHLLQDPTLAYIEEYLKKRNKKLETETVLDELMTLKNTHRTKDKMAPMKNNQLTLCINQICTVLTRTKSKLTLVEPEEPNHPLLHGLALEQAKRVMQQYPKPQTLLEESKTNETKAGLLRETSTDSCLRTLDLAEKRTILENQVLVLIEQGQFTAAEKYILANQQWHPDLNINDFIKNRVEKNQDEKLDARWKIRAKLIYFIQINDKDMKEKEKLLEMSEAKNYELLFKSTAKLAHKNTNAIPILTDLIKQAKAFDLAIDSIQIPVGQKGKQHTNAVDYICNLSQNAKQSKEIEQLKEVIQVFKIHKENLAQSIQPKVKEPVSKGKKPSNPSQEILSEAERKLCLTTINKLEKGNFSRSIPMTQIESKQPVFHAIHQKNYAQVKALIKKNKSLVYSTDAGYTLLHWATRAEELELVQFLIENGADPNAEEPRGATPISIAAMKGNFAIVHFLLKQKDIKLDVLGSGPDEKPSTALYEAVTKTLPKYFPVICALLKAGASMYTPCIHGKSNPIYAVVCVGTIDAINLFLKEKGDLNVPTETGLTPIFAAVYRKELKVLNLVCEAGANLHHLLPKRESVLHIAASLKDNFEVVKFLVGKRININQARCDGATPLFLAARYSGDIDTVKFLLEAGANTNFSLLISKSDLLSASKEQPKDAQIRINSWMKKQDKNKEMYYLKPDEAADMIGNFEIASLIRSYRPNPYAFYPRKSLNRVKFLQTDDFELNKNYTI